MVHWFDWLIRRAGTVEHSNPPPEHMPEMHAARNAITGPDARIQMAERRIEQAIDNAVVRAEVESLRRGDGDAE